MATTLLHSYFMQYCINTDLDDEIYYDCYRYAWLKIFTIDII